MKKLVKASGIYGIVSAAAMAVIWAVICASGLLRADIAAHATEYGFLLVAESIAAASLLISGIGLLRGKPIGMFCAAMGMLLYAVILGAGKFLERGLPAPAVLFLAVAVATAVMLALNLRSGRSEGV